MRDTIPPPLDHAAATVRVAASLAERTGIPVETAAAIIRDLCQRDARVEVQALRDAAADSPYEDTAEYLDDRANEIEGRLG